MNKSLKNSTYLDFLKLDQILNFSKIFFIPAFILFLTFLFTSLYLGLINSPSDYLQGEHYRIIFIHVPCAWYSIIIYCIMTILSIIYLLNRHPLVAYVTNVLSIFGILFTMITLITGSLWGLPMWGTWWVWDARLTSVLINLFLYIGYRLIFNSFKDFEKSFYYSSIICIIGFLNIPIIKYSVNWWSTLHQPASITKAGSTIHISMLYPILFMTVSLLLFCITFSIILLRNTILKNKIRALQTSIT